MFGSRQKGASAEREVAAIVQAWWRQIEPRCTFVRTPGSGGWATPQLRNEYRASGDLMTSAKRWPYTLEIKRRENWNFDRFLDGKSSPVWKWWRQALVQGEEAKAVPLLWFRKNRDEWRILMPIQHAVGLCILIVGWTRDRAWHGGVVPCMVDAARFIELDPERVALKE